MIHKTYGNYVNGLKGDIWNVLNYLGRELENVRNDVTRVKRTVSGSSSPRMGNGVFLNHSPEVLLIYAT